MAPFLHKFVTTLSSSMCIIPKFSAKKAVKYLVKTTSNKLDKDQDEGKSFCSNANVAHCSSVAVGSRQSCLQRPPGPWDIYLALNYILQLFKKISTIVNIRLWANWQLFEQDKFCTRQAGLCFLTTQSMQSRPVRDWQSQRWRKLSVPLLIQEYASVP